MPNWIASHEKPEEKIYGSSVGFKKWPQSPKLLMKNYWQSLLSKKSYTIKEKNT